MFKGVGDQVRRESKQQMRVLLIADFRTEFPRFILNNSRIFSKGFVRNGHDVLEFSYRSMLLQLSPVKSKKWALRLAKKKTDQLLLKLVRNHQPELVFISAFKLLDEKTLQQLREELPRAVFMCWYGDPPRGIDTKVDAMARKCDWLLATSGGELLRKYKQMGVKNCAFMPNPADRDFEYPRQVSEKWRSELLFAGKLSHHQEGGDPIREDLIRYLIEKKGMTVWGCLGQPRVEGYDYLNAVCGTKMALSINVNNDVRFYHSDRLTHLLGCGAFVLSRYVPDSDLLFEDKKHLCYFHSIEECSDLVDQFRQDQTLRKKIAEQGYKRAHEGFNCEKLAGYVVDLAQGREFQEPWCEIL